MGVLQDINVYIKGIAVGVSLVATLVSGGRANAGDAKTLQNFGYDSKVVQIINDEDIPLDIKQLASYFSKAKTLITTLEKLEEQQQNISGDFKKFDDDAKIAETIIKLTVAIRELMQEFINKVYSSSINKKEISYVNEQGILVKIFGVRDYIEPAIKIIKYCDELILTNSQYEIAKLHMSLLKSNTGGYVRQTASVKRAINPRILRLIQLVEAEWKGMNNQIRERILMLNKSGLKSAAKELTTMWNNFNVDLKAMKNGEEPPYLEFFEKYNKKLDFGPVKYKTGIDAE